MGQAMQFLTEETEDKGDKGDYPPFVKHEDKILHAGVTPTDMKALEERDALDAERKSMLERLTSVDLEGRPLEGLEKGDIDDPKKPEIGEVDVEEALAFGLGSTDTAVAASPKEPAVAKPKITIVTGGAGFIGSHLIEKLNSRGTEGILLVDDLSHPDKLQNIKDLKFQDYVDISKFPDLLMFMAENTMVEEVYHMGADSDSSCTDGKHMMENNYQYTCNIMDICHMGRIPMVYASSSAVYGNQTKEWGNFDDKSDDYVPESYYALAKLQADRYSRKFMAQGPDKTKIIGLRYFNVISDGKREQHKGDMKSATAWMKEQYEETGMIRLFKGSEDIKRDFVSVEAVVGMTVNAMTSGRSGVYNIGTGESRSFLDLALEVVDGDEEKITYFSMPYDMRERYQMFTQANMNNACFGIISRP